jgi:hypothetical protein
MPLGHSSIAQPKLSSACFRPAATPRFSNGIIDRPACRPIPFVPLLPLAQWLHGRVPPSSKQEAARDLSFPSRDNPVITCRYMYHSNVVHVQVVPGGAAGQSLGRASTLRIERFMQRVVAASRPSDWRVSVSLGLGMVETVLALPWATFLG